MELKLYNSLTRSKEVFTPLQPPQVGLYASILPLFLYGLFGTSRVLAVGPVAIVSILVASGIGEHQIGWKIVGFASQPIGDP